MRLWVRATQLSFTIAQTKLQWGPRLNCGLAIAVHSLSIQLCQRKGSDGIYRIAGDRSRFIHCLSIVQAELQTLFLHNGQHRIALHYSSLPLCRPNCNHDPYRNVGVRSRHAASMRNCARQTAMIAPTELRQRIALRNLHLRYSKPNSKYGNCRIASVLPLCATCFYNCASWNATMASTEFRVCDQAKYSLSSNASWTARTVSREMRVGYRCTQFTFKIAQTDLQGRPLQPVWNRDTTPNSTTVQTEQQWLRSHNCG